MVGDSTIDVVVWVRNFGIIVIEAFPDDPGSPGDAGKKPVGRFIWFHSQV
jgi:hypothetical protein